MILEIYMDRRHVESNIYQYVDTANKATFSGVREAKKYAKANGYLKLIVRNFVKKRKTEYIF